MKVDLIIIIIIKYITKPSRILFICCPIQCSLSKVAYLSCCSLVLSPFYLHSVTNLSLRFHNSQSKLFYCSPKCLRMTIQIFFTVFYVYFTANFSYIVLSACGVRAAILTEVFPCFFLSCKANARI
jgi:hypothetical protein